MKIKNISLTNFAKYDNVTCSFDPNVTYLIGKNGSGKSTLGISAIWFMFCGIAEKNNGTNPIIGERFRFIGPKAATAKGEMILMDEKLGTEIKVTRKLTKTGTDLSFEGPDGMELGQGWLTDLFNLFLIAPKRFTELSSREQAKALGIDTSSFDKDLAELKSEYTLINRDLKPYLSMEVPEKVERVDIESLRAQKEQLREQLNQKYQENKATNETLRKEWEAKRNQVNDETVDFNKKQLTQRQLIEECHKHLLALTDRGYPGTEVRSWIASLDKPQEGRKASDFYPPEPEYLTELPDDSELKALDSKIDAAHQNNLAALVYHEYTRRLEEKAAIEQKLANNKTLQQAKEKARMDYVKGFKFPFSNLTIGEDGELLLNNKPIHPNYWSSGELIKIVVKLMATRNPELKYIFLQDFNLLDEDTQTALEADLTGQGFQLVVELVGKEKLIDKNCILLKDNIPVESYQENAAPQLV